MLFSFCLTIQNSNDVWTNLSNILKTNDFVPLLDFKMFENLIFILKRNYLIESLYWLNQIDSISMKLNKTYDNLKVS